MKLKYTLVIIAMLFHVKSIVYANNSLKCPQKKFKCTSIYKKVNSGLDAFITIGLDKNLCHKNELLEYKIFGQVKTEKETLKHLITEGNLDTLGIDSVIHQHRGLHFINVEKTLSPIYKFRFMYDEKAEERGYKYAALGLLVELPKALQNKKRRFNIKFGFKGDDRIGDKRLKKINELEFFPVGQLVNNYDDYSRKYNCKVL